MTLLVVSRAYSEHSSSDAVVEYDSPILQDTCCTGQPECVATVGNVALSATSMHGVSVACFDNVLSKSTFSDKLALETRGFPEH